jgi:hypothetical protein
MRSFQIINGETFQTNPHFCSMNNARIALVEIGGSHDECILTQVNALKTRKTEIHLICDSKVRERNEYLNAEFKEIYEVNTTGSALGDVRLMRGIIRYLKENRIEKVVFNTAQGGHIRNLALMMPKSIQCYGIIHTIRKFNESFTQKIIHKMIKRYAVLSDDLLKRVKPNSKINVRSFYPIEFPVRKEEKSENGNEIIIGIPGGVENRRKDLAAFSEMISQTPENIRFIFLGNSDFSRSDTQEFIATLEAGNLMKRVELFDHFIPTGEFFTRIQACDFLLPLIHPDTPSADEYIVNQISGSFSLSFGLKIPLLIHEAYQTEDDLQKSAFFYTPEHFCKKLESAIEERPNKIVEIDSVSKWKNAFQHRNFVQFIELI